MTRSHSSGWSSRNGPTCVWPALLTRPSMRPKRSIDLLDQALRLPPSAQVGGERLRLDARLADALDRSCRRRPRPVVVDRDVCALRSPALAAISAPMPRLLPVTSTTRPASASGHQSSPAVTSAARMAAVSSSPTASSGGRIDGRLDHAELLAARPWSVLGSRAPARRRRPPRAAGCAPRSRAPRSSNPRGSAGTSRPAGRVASVPKPISAPSAPITNDS